MVNLKTWNSFKSKILLTSSDEVDRTESNQNSSVNWYLMLQCTRNFFSLRKMNLHDIFRMITPIIETKTCNFYWKHINGSVLWTIYTFGGTSCSLFQFFSCSCMKHRCPATENYTFSHLFIDFLNFLFFFSILVSCIILLVVL